MSSAQDDAGRNARVLAGLVIRESVLRRLTRRHLKYHSNNSVADHRRSHNPAHPLIVPLMCDIVLDPRATNRYRGTTTGPPWSLTWRESNVPPSPTTVTIATTVPRLDGSGVIPPKLTREHVRSGQSYGVSKHDDAGFMPQPPEPLARCMRVPVCYDQSPL